MNAMVLRGSFLILIVFVLNRIDGQAQSTTDTGSLRLCRCDELEECRSNQSQEYANVLQKCGQHCAGNFLLNTTADKVIGCYNSYGGGKRDSKSSKQNCLEKFGIRRCLAEKTPTEPIIQINASQLVRPAKVVKRNTKPTFPPEMVLFNNCFKTCRKNPAILEPKTETPAAATKTDKKVKQPKALKGDEFCASKLNCQLMPLDKKLEKEAKQLCKIQMDPKPDSELELCNCLETAIGQDLQCSVPAETCASRSTSCESASGSESKEKK